ncbi:pseudouridine synthase [Flavihumibacter profundi]|uniref:pseudouridine synthase n=1 Tax=Flavihumibacter profundi TaxID=2716883 RepID=UPI001CC6F425|nr:pseudouridine synthase [Flavihumibacter profundi]MBZ5859486.1 rRNA pseudouridine synthase [Flavihumibacter profundi]
MKKSTGFEKFANKKKAGTIKEAYRKERREIKNERAEAIKEKIDEKRKSRYAKPEAPATRPSHSKAITKSAVKIADKTPPAGVANAGQHEHGASLMPLNKFIAHCGVCARRDAAALVKEGIVTVNGANVTEPGFKVTEKDIITVKGKRVTITKNLVYILLNKPKDYITTTEDPQGRKTVLDLIKTATSERVYPVGRLDRNTSGVLLFTNDGDLAQTLSHPKNQVKKIYEVKLDKPLTKNDFDTIRNGITLEDGFVAPDALGYADPKDKSVIGIEIHSGRNRIVRRIFEHMKYDVRGLDRVMYAGLTKKNVLRGKWRLLTEKEVRLLKHFNKSTKKEKSDQ